MTPNAPDESEALPERRGTARRVRFGVTMRVTVIAMALLGAVGVFVVLHSGAFGDAACERSRFVPSSGLSAWPPGVQCQYRQPARTDVIVNDWFVLVVLALAVALVYAYVALGPRLRAT